MALKIGDRVRENTSSTGVGGLSLTGAPAGFQRFSAILASGDITYYSLEENDKFEVGIGTYGSNNLERTTVLSSSNSGNKIELGGSGVVFITYPASRAIFSSETGQFVLGASGLLFANGTNVKEGKLVELADVSLSGTPVQNSVFDLNITNKSLSIGDQTGPTNSNNILIGYGAGSGITSGSDSVIIGAESSTINKTGQHNVHIGTKAGPVTSDSASSVYNSVAVGYSAGNKMRHESIAIGYQSAENAYEIGFIGIGYQVGNGLGSYSTAIGYQAANSLGENYAIALGYQAGYNGAGESAVWIGQGAGHSSTGSAKSIGIGKNAGKSSSGAECIYIGESAGLSNSSSNLLFIGNGSPAANDTLIKGDMDAKRIAIGVADVTLDDTLFVGVNSANDEGIVVKAAVSQVSNLTSWKNSSDSVLASVSKDGVVSAHEIVATGNGIQIASLVPASTTNKLYNSAGSLYFNGSQVSAPSGVPSGIAFFGLDKAIAQDSNIVYDSGNQRINLGSGGLKFSDGTIQTTADNDTYVSGIAVYSSGQTISNQSNITALLVASGTATSLISSSGVAAYASGQAVSNQSTISINTSRVAYASGQAISNQSEIIAVSGWSDSTFLKIDDDTYVSGIAAYGSGQAVSNQSNITTNASNISTNTGNISSNTAKVNYASGQAIENESDIAALLTASGTATSLIASSGIANYASGQAVSNQASITTNANNITYVSGVATNKFTVTAADSSNYTIDGMGLNSATDPSIYLHKGHTYYFDKQTSSHPFRVSTSNGGAAYQDADGNSIEISGQGVLKFEVPQNAPDKLYYYCTSHAAMNGVIYTTNNVDEIIHVSGIAAYASGQAITNQSNVTALNTASGIATSLLAVSGTATSLVSTSGIATYASGQAVSNQSNITALLTASGTATSLIASSGIASYASGQAIANESDIFAVSGIAAYASGTSGAGGSITVKEADGSPNVSNVTTIVVSNGTLTDNGGGQVTVTTGGGGGGGDVTTAQLNYVSGIAVYSSGQSILNQSNITALSTASGIATSLLAVSGTATSLVATSGIATYASGNTANISFGSNAEGDLLYHNGTSFIRLPKGTDDYILKMNGNVPNWEADSGGSSLSAGSGVFVDGASKINVYGGSGNFQELQVTSDNVFVPKVVFTGSGAVDTPITLETRSSYESVSGSGSALLFQGTQGQLFSITDNLSSGVIFSVADIAGLPLIEADASGDVKLGEFGRYVGVGSGVPEYGLDISASGRIQKGVVLSSYVPAVTTNTLYNEGGTLKFNGSSIGGGGVDTYTSGVATYASGQAISNQSSITALLSASGTATSLIASSGIATYASGQAIENEGLATYASGQAIANESDILATSGIAAYASGQITPALTAGSGITIDGADKINVHGGSGHFINLAVDGAFSATTKSFLIDHPTKGGMKLQYGSLEGPENGVYIRGTSGSNVITLPEYWSTLVDQSTVTVTLTSIGYYQPLFIKEKGKNYIKVGGCKGSYDYVVYGERKDVEKIEGGVVMGVTYNNRIVTDGLVLCLDAASKRSYPGTGTVWTDLKGGNNGTLVNGPTFDADNGGSIVFDGSNDQVSTNANVPAYGSNPRSICVWFYYTGGSKNLVGFGANSNAQLFDVITWFSGGYYRIVTHHYGSGQDTIPSLPSRNTINLNSWNYFCATYESGTVSVYTNGVFSNSNSLSLNTASSVLYIGRGLFAGYNYFNGKVSQVSLYDKALTADEIRRNYLSTKERYL